MEKPDPTDLRRVALFEGLSDGDYRLLAERLESQWYDAGHRLIREHDHGYAFYILVAGQAHAEVDGRVLEVMEPGAVFGEMAFFYPDSRRTATVMSDTRVHVYRMFGTHFREMEMSSPEITSRLRRLVDERAARKAAAEANKAV